MKEAVSYTHLDVYKRQVYESEKKAVQLLSIKFKANDEVKQMLKKFSTTKFGRYYKGDERSRTATGSL